MTGALRVGALLVALAATVAGCAGDPPPKVPLKELYTPHFAAAPRPAPAAETLRSFADSWPPIEDMKARAPFLPDQAGVLWLSLIVTLLVGFDFRNLRNPRNVDLLLLQAIGWCFFDILGFLDRLRNPTTYRIMDWVFTAVVALSATVAVRALLHSVRGIPARWHPGAGGRAVAAAAIALLTLDVAIALYSPPDDAGYFINIGGQRLRERLRWPYGDPLLTGTPAAAYGPVLYAAHVPFQLLLAPEPVNAESPPRPLIETGDVYFLPPLTATKLCTIAFHLIGVAALFGAARRLAGAAAAWSIVAMYCGSAFVLGVGGGDYSIGGMTFTSHIAPAAVTLLAFALLERPAWSGVALAAGIGSLFYPVFFVPAWLGYYWRRKDRLRRFLFGFVVASLVVGGSVLLLSRPANGRSRIGTIVYDTIGHQESAAAYGSSPFGFWGQRGGVRGWLMTPLVGEQSLTRPVVLAFFVFAAGMFVAAQGRTAPQLALIVAAVAIGAQLWKIHATATYVTWYYPFLLVGFFCDQPPSDTSRA